MVSGFADLGFSSPQKLLQRLNPRQLSELRQLQQQQKEVALTAAAPKAGMGSLDEAPVSSDGNSPAVSDRPGQQQQEQQQQQQGRRKIRVKVNKGSKASPPPPQQQQQQQTDPAAAGAKKQPSPYTLLQSSPPPAAATAAQQTSAAALAADTAAAAPAAAATAGRRLQKGGIPQPDTPRAPPQRRVSFLLPLTHNSSDTKPAAAAAAAAAATSPVTSAAANIENDSPEQQNATLPNSNADHLGELATAAAALEPQAASGDLSPAAATAAAAAGTAATAAAGDTLAAAAPLSLLLPSAADLTSPLHSLKPSVSQLLASDPISVMCERPEGRCVTSGVYKPCSNAKSGFGGSGDSLTGGSSGLGVLWGTDSNAAAAAATTAAAGGSAGAAPNSVTTGDDRLDPAAAFEAAAATVATAAEFTATLGPASSAMGQMGQQQPFGPGVGQVTLLPSIPPAAGGPGVTLSVPQVPFVWPQLNISSACLPPVIMPSSQQHHHQQQQQAGFVVPTAQIAAAARPAAPAVLLDPATALPAAVEVGPMQAEGSPAAAPDTSAAATTNSIADAVKARRSAGRGRKRQQLRPQPLAAPSSGHPSSIPSSSKRSRNSPAPAAVTVVVASPGDIAVVDPAAAAALPRSLSSMLPPAAKRSKSPAAAHTPTDTLAAPALADLADNTSPQHKGVSTATAGGGLGGVGSSSKSGQLGPWDDSLTTPSMANLQQLLLEPHNAAQHSMPQHAPATAATGSDPAAAPAAGVPSVGRTVRGSAAAKGALQASAPLSLQVPVGGLPAVAAASAAAAVPGSMAASDVPISASLTYLRARPASLPPPAPTAAKVSSFAAACGASLTPPPAAAPAAGQAGAVSADGVAPGVSYRLSHGLSLGALTAAPSLDNIDMSSRLFSFPLVSAASLAAAADAATAAGDAGDMLPMGGREVGSAAAAAAAEGAEVGVAGDRFDSLTDLMAAASDMPGTKLLTALRSGSLLNPAGHMPSAGFEPGTSRFAARPSVLDPALSLPGLRDSSLAQVFADVSGLLPSVSTAEGVGLGRLGSSMLSLALQPASEPAALGAAAVDEIGNAIGLDNPNDNPAAAAAAVGRGGKGKGKGWFISKAGFSMCPMQLGIDMQDTQGVDVEQSGEEGATADSSSSAARESAATPTTPATDSPSSASGSRSDAAYAASSSFGSAQPEQDPEAFNRLPLVNPTLQEEKLATTGSPAGRPTAAADARPAGQAIFQGEAEGQEDPPMLLFPPAAAPVSAGGRMNSMVLLPMPHQLAASNRL